MVKYDVERRKLEEAWMDLYEPITKDDADLAVQLEKLKEMLEPGYPDPPSIPLGLLKEEIPAESPPTSGADSGVPSSGVTATSKPSEGTRSATSRENVYERLSLDAKIQVLNDRGKEKFKADFPFREDLSAWLFFIAAMFQDN